MSRNDLASEIPIHEEKAEGVIPPTFIGVHVERHTPLYIEEINTEDIPIPPDVRDAIETGIMTGTEMAHMILTQFLAEEERNPDIDDDDRTIEVTVAIVLEQYGTAKVEL
jgi:hypothetical protein